MVNKSLRSFERAVNLMLKRNDMLSAGMPSRKMYPLPYREAIVTICRLQTTKHQRHCCSGTAICFIYLQVVEKHIAKKTPTWREQNNRLYGCCCRKLRV
jgi:hypothetical protein